jgi:hypothetical protein
MMKLKNLILLLIFNIIATNCSSLSDASKILRDEKITTTDEFLVKKRQPLSIPPNFEELIKPNSKESKKEVKTQDELNKIFKIKNNNDGANSSSISSEESILKQIR